MRALFHTDPLSQPMKDRLGAAVKNARDEVNKKRHNHKLNAKAASRRLHGLTGSAEPGPSGTRNTHIKSLLKVRTGAQALTDYAKVWSGSSISKQAVDVWMNLTINPLRKPNGGIRPIGLCEAMLKTVIGLHMHVGADSMRGILEPTQVSVHTPGGGEEKNPPTRLLQRPIQDLQ